MRTEMPAHDSFYYYYYYYYYHYCIHYYYNYIRWTGPDPEAALGIMENPAPGFAESAEDEEGEDRRCSTGCVGGTAGCRLRVAAAPRENHA